MLSFVDWMKSLNEMAWLQHSLRSRVSRMGPGITAHQHPTVKHRSGEPIAIDYADKDDAREDIQKAAQRAQEINMTHPGGVNVYFAIVPNNAIRPLDSTLKWLIKPPNARREISVSVKKGVWESGMVLVGRTKKLIAYWNTDVRTKHVPGGPEILPTQAHRPDDFRPYDEAIVRVGDIKWHTIYYDPTDDFIANKIGRDYLMKLSSELGMELKTIGKDSDPLVAKRHGIELTMRDLISHNNNMKQMLLRVVSDIVQQSDVSAEIAGNIAIIGKTVAEHDPTHPHLRDHASRRMDAMKKSFMWLKSLLNQIYEFIEDETSKGF